MSDVAKIAAGLSDAEVDVLTHTLGLDRSRDEYRNFFSASEGHSDWETLMGLLERGLMVRRPLNSFSGINWIFVATEAGKSAARQHLADQSDA